MAVHRILARLVLGKADYIVTFSHVTTAQARQEFPRGKIIPIAGLPFNPEKKNKSISRETARRELNIEGKIILFFGFVRSYKGLDDLLEALPPVLQKNPDALLVIAGEFWKDKSHYFESITRLGIAPRVRIMDKYIPEDQVATLFSAADLVVLPYRSISQSGVIPLAFAFGTPVIATRVGGNTDWVEDEKNGFLVPTHSPIALASAINRFFLEKKAAAFRKGIAGKIAEMEWNSEKERAVLQLPRSRGA
jgi:glycosyltransferase involved in cell wall biosynthesis